MTKAEKADKILGEALEKLDALGWDHSLEDDDNGQYIIYTGLAKGFGKPTRYRQPKD